MAKKCHKCANSRHACVLVELPLWPKLKEVNSARAALARSISRGDDEDEQAEREDRARTLGQELIDELKSFDKNRKNQQGDRAVPRKRGAAGAHTGGTDPLLLAELQSIRRGMLALVEVGKAVSFLPSSWRYALANNMRSSCATAPSRTSSWRRSMLPLALTLRSWSQRRMVRRRRLAVMVRVVVMRGWRSRGGAGLVPKLIPGGVSLARRRP